MTATVTVRTRAVGATVKVGEQETNIGPHASRDFHVDGSSTITVTEAEPSADTAGAETAADAERPLDTNNVPGRKQNDELVPPADGSAFDHDGDGKPGGSLPKTKR